MKHEERQIDDLDGPETDLDMQKKEKSMTQLANVAALNLTENEKTIIEKAEKQMNSDSRVSEFVKKKSRTLKIKTRFLGVKDEPISALDEPMSALDFTSTTPFLEPMPEIPDVARRRAKTIMEDNMSPGLLSPSLESGKSFHGRNSIFEKSPKKSRPTTPKRSSIIHTPMIRAATPLSPLRNEPIEQQDSFVSEGTVYTNPFGSMIQLIPEENQHQSLSEWHQKVVNQGIVEEPKMEHWNAVNVEAVAEFGTTLYTKRFLDMALAAETEGYQPQPVNVLDPDRQIRKVSRDRAGYKKVGNQKFWLLKE
jgi:hypothetical protein